MSSPIYFVQECPTCGRRLQIRVEYLGKKMVCQHCQGKFIAADSTNPCGPATKGHGDLLRRADELLGASCQETRSTGARRSV